MMLRLRDQHLDLLVGYAFLALAALTQEPEHHLAGFVEQPDERRGYLGQNGHRPSHAHRDRFGVAQGDLLRHQFTDDEGSIGDQRDHKTDAEPVGNAVGHAVADQRVCQPLADRRAGEGARQHADQRNADLNGWRKRRIGRQLESTCRSLGVRVLALDHPL